MCVLLEHTELVDVEKSKSCKKQKPYIAAPTIPEVLSLLIANAIRIGYLQYQI
jgi:hypothetical protein